MALSIAQPVHAAPPTAEAMRWHRRLLLIATPSPQDRLAVEQRRILEVWKRGAVDRDLTLVEVSGGHVTGLADTAASLRQRYAIKPGRFEVLLIGKDGHRDALCPADTGQHAAKHDRCDAHAQGGRAVSAQADTVVARIILAPSDP